MADFIERGKALAMRFTDGINEDGVIYVPWRDVVQHLKTLPSADVVKVVRCRDCVWYSDNWCGNDEIPFVGDDASYFAPSETFYCPLGERRNNNG